MDNIEEIVKSVIGKIAQHQPNHQIELEKIWNRFVDGNSRKHASFQGVKNNTIYVVVDSPIRLHQLKSKKNILLRKFKEVAPDIVDIMYKVGQV